MVELGAEHSMYLLFGCEDGECEGELEDLTKMAGGFGRFTGLRNHA
jgi:hypothetical protein